MKSKLNQMSLVDMPSVITPLFKEKPGRDWISYGADDQYGTFLEELYLGSSINSAIINGVSEMIYGEGLDSRTEKITTQQRSNGFSFKYYLVSLKTMYSRRCVWT